jgi:hypothetical protein
MSNGARTVWGRDGDEIGKLYVKAIAAKRLEVEGRGRVLGREKAGAEVSFGIGFPGVSVWWSK